MQVSVSKESKLGRKLHVEVPENKIVEKEEKRFRSLIKTTKVDGFRKGKVPLKIIKERYGAQVRYEVLGEAIQSALFEAITQENLKPAGMPNILETNYEPGKPLKFVAEFEIYPEVKVQPFTKLAIERLVAEVAEEDLQRTLDSIRSQYKNWHDVDRAAKSGDQVDMNFVGSINGEEFAGGKADNFKLELGAGRMIPGFEDGIIGMKAGEEKVIQVTFPENYGEPSLAAKVADFKITVNAVAESSLPEVNDEFAERLGIQAGGVAKLTEEIRNNMQRELTTAMQSDVKHKVMDQLLEHNKIDLPKALIDREIEHLQQEAEKKYGKAMAFEGTKEQSRAIFEKEAERRVSLGLLISEIIDSNSIKVDAAQVRQKVEEIAAVYEKPQDIVAMFYNDKQRLANIEALVLEDMVVEKILQEAKVKDKSVPFTDLIKPHQH